MELLENTHMNNEDKRKWTIFAVYVVDFVSNSAALEVTGPVYSYVASTI